MRIAQPYYLIIDLEATCADDGSIPRDEMEIIEIGAVVQSSSTFAVESSYQTFVRPVRHPTLTPFCRELTTLTQADMEAAPSFPKALSNLIAWLRPFEGAVFCSWGDYDRKQLQQDCRYHGLDYPFGSPHVNLKAAFSEAMQTRKRFGIGAALRRVGLDFHGTPHRGIDDAQNIARIVGRMNHGA